MWVNKNECTPSGTLSPKQPLSLSYSLLCTERLSTSLFKNVWVGEREEQQHVHKPHVLKKYTHTDGFNVFVEFALSSRRRFRFPDSDLPDYNSCSKAKKLEKEGDQDI